MGNLALLFEAKQEHAGTSTGCKRARTRQQKGGNSVGTGRSILTEQGAAHCTTHRSLMETCFWRFHREEHPVLGEYPVLHRCWPGPSFSHGGRVLGGRAGDVLQKANEMACDLQLQLNIPEALVPGVRRGFVLVPVDCPERRRDRGQRASIYDGSTPQMSPWVASHMVDATEA